MALSSLLLGSKKVKLDSELDSLFKTDVPQTRPPPPPTASSSTTASQLKRKQNDAEIQPTESSKRLKGAPKDNLAERQKHTEKEKSKKSKKAKRTKKDDKKDKDDEEMEDDEDNSDLEQAYVMKALASRKGKEKVVAEKHMEEDDDDEEDIEDNEDHSDSDSDDDASPPQHESLSKPTKRSQANYEDETPEKRDHRTIFIGNLSVEVAQKKPLRKQLQRHILSLIPSNGPKPKVESIRFRSVPFATPTSTLPEDEDAKSEKGKKKHSSRQHDVERTTNWKNKEAEGDTEKKFLTPAQKKKVAFINQDFHDSANTVHAYIVFARPPTDAEGAVKRKPNLPPASQIMDPYEAARLAKEACDGTTFMERVIRVDIAAKNPAAATEGRVVKSDGDPKKSIFVGNLEFASKEEDVRVFFETLITAEKGPRSGDSDGEDDETSAAKPKTWVKRVRIIRDKDTQLGKGFAYVQFANHECVDEILALEPTKVKFAKRKLRVERCKTLPGVSTKVSSKQAKPSRERPAAVAVPIPKGNPALGEKLVHMSKEDRKKAKATDPERLARRLAKKKARMALAVPGKGTEGLKILGKDRNRERKTGPAKSKGKHGVGSSTKSRVRSERNAEKRNVKK